MLESKTRDAVGMALDGLQQRHSALTANIVNADTPNYKSLDVSFESQLKSFIGKGSDADQLPLLTTQNNHLDPTVKGFGSSGNNTSQPDTTEAQTTYRPDGNGVDIDREMARLSQTTERYLALSQIEGKMYKSMRTLITSAVP